MNLDPTGVRVLGCLAEKGLTTPQQYPLTLNALLAAANQSSNREPVTAYGEDQILAALDELKAGGLVRFVLPSHGRSVLRYRQILDEVHALDSSGLALVALLMLRGPQTVGELRSRSERMTDFEHLGAVEHELERLATSEPPLVARLARRPGQKEERWQHLLGGPEAPPEAAAPAPSGGAEAHLSGVAGEAASGPEGALASLRAEVQALRSEVEAQREALGLQRQALEALRQSLGG